MSGYGSCRRYVLSLNQWPEIIFDLNASSVLLSDDDQEPLISQFKMEPTHEVMTLSSKI